MDTLTPGIRFLIQRFSAVALPCLTTYIALNYGQRHLFDTQILSNASILVFATLSPVLIALTRSAYTAFMDSQRAAAMGAIKPPTVYDPSPFGIGWKTAKTMKYGIEFGYIGETLSRWFDEYGNTFGMNILGDFRIMTTEPEHVKAILATQFDHFEKGPYLFSTQKSLLGVGIFNSDGDVWKFHRNLTRPWFSKERISDFDIFDRHAYGAIQLARSRLSEGYPIDFQDMVARFTLDSATSFLFGIDVRSLSAGLPYPSSPSPLARENPASFTSHPSTKFVDAFVAGETQTLYRSMTGKFWPLREVFGDKVYKERKVIDGFIDDILDQFVGKKLSGEKDLDLDGGEQAEKATLLSYLVEQTQDKQLIRDEINNLLVAGRDTTMCLLTFATYMLSQHPDTTRRLRTEVLDKVGPSARPSYQHIRDMKYLRAFLNEVLRLYPPVPLDSRASNRPTVLPSKDPSRPPVYVPANTRCAYSLLLMHRRKDLWGPDADEFDPDRFIDERAAKYLVPNPFIFLPFNAGPRICLGQQFAYHEASFFMIRLLQSFSSFTLAPEAQPPSTLPPASWKDKAGRQAIEKICPGSHLTMFVKGGLWVRMEEATSQ